MRALKEIVPRRLLLIAALGAVLSTTGHIAAPRPRLLYGPLVGDLTASTAVVWCRVEGLSQVTCQLRAADAETQEPVFTEVQHTLPQRSCAAKFGIEGLRPATDYSITIPELGP